MIITVPNEENLTIEKCPKCDHHFYINNHINSFKAAALKKIIFTINPYVRSKVKVIKFHTIFSYNRITIKWPAFLRTYLDQFLVFFSSKVPFLKPNYLLLSIKKLN